MRQLADVTPLVGKTFQASSGNVCSISMLGAGGISAGWKWKHTPQDCAEFEAWVQTIIGPTDTETFDSGKRSEGGLAKEREFYGRFLRGEGKP